MESEKEALISDQPPIDRHRRSDGAPNPAFRFVVNTFFATLLVLGFQLGMRSVVWRVSNDVSSHCPHRLTYPGEKISWTPCGAIDDHELECATIDVPMDHFNKSNNARGKAFSIPLTRLRGKNATQNLLLNPGGPGGSGTEFISRRGAQLSAIVGENFHLLGFDPRGINKSRPLASCYPDFETRRRLSPVRSKKLVEDSGELFAWTANLVQACADNMGEHGAYINTPQTAADMNDILDAVGQDDMYYWGFSYGTLLGQTYATMFSDRTKRVIIDGVASQFDWYEETLDNEAIQDTDSVFEGFVDECIKAGPEKCALASLAKTKEALSEKLVSEIENLRDNPISVYINSTVYGIVDYWKVWHQVVFISLYRPAQWYATAEKLDSLLRGNATDIFLQIYAQENPFDTEEDAERFVTLNDGKSGPAPWPQDRGEAVSMMQSFFNQSLFADVYYPFYVSKRAWTAVPRTHGYVPRRGVKTAHPLLILSTTYDPVCPLISARGANAAFEGSRLVELKGYGHCSLAVPSLCITHYVRDFLLEGKLPDENARCDADGSPYFAKPDEGDKVTALAQFSDPEDRKIHLAQVKLAREVQFRWKF
ncbi:Alpha/Beta hydrolase protein [Lasiosphaeria hispida]|uniref:Alpha/Beta hydrolase protein n=1 Tax=Lasiosphaeria hispida TaxID=260671 RepID=A0AAJ0HDS7_9PEZI|nr:Alpha/Beta hydrolase protein [Lasiosphaeria hispida]